MSPSASPSGPENPISRLSTTAVVLLMTLGTLGQLALNIVLPSLPAIGAELQTAPGAERLVLSVFLIGFAGGQLLVGPLSDRFGRRVILLPGLALYALLGGAAAMTASLEWLLAARLIQGLGAAAGFVIARAVARDVFEGPALIRIFGLLTLTMGIVPGAAPVLGGLIQDSVGWEVNMLVTAAAGTLIFALCFFILPETGTRSDVEFAPSGVVISYISILKDPTFMRFSGTNALALGSLYAFHAGGPELMIAQQGISASAYGIVALLHSSAYMGGAAMITRLGPRIKNTQRAMAWAVSGMLASAIAMLALGLSGNAQVVPITALMVVFGFGLGATLPLGVAGALSPFKARAGAATALLGAMQMSAGAAASAVVAFFDSTPEIAFPMVMIAMTGLAVFNARRP